MLRKLKIFNDNAKVVFIYFFDDFLVAIAVDLAVIIFQKCTYALFDELNSFSSCGQNSEMNSRTNDVNIFQRHDDKAIFF